MIVGFFWSRALLSLSVAGLFMNALHPDTIRAYFSGWRNDAFSVFCLLFFLAYFLSGIWSSDKVQWWNAVTNKIPFAVLPFAFFSIPVARPRFRRWILIVLFLMQTLVICYSLFMLMTHFHFYVKGYNYSYSLPTTKYDDHIRFSLSLVLSLIIIFYLLFERKSTTLSVTAYRLLFILGLLFIVYLHILAAKTGLVCFYLATLIYICFCLARKRLRLAALFAVVLLFPVVAYVSVPTFRTKINYVFYEIDVYKSQHVYNYQLSDPGRVLSYKMGARLIKSHPLWGVGAGDVMDAMDSAYAVFHPEVPPEKRLVPHNQFLFSIVGLGFPLSLFLVGMCLPSFKKEAIPSIYPILTSIIMVIAMMAEAMLEIQFGVFIFLFFNLFWRGMRQRPLS